MREIDATKAVLRIAQEEIQRLQEARDENARQVLGVKGENRARLLAAEEEVSRVKSADEEQKVREIKMVEEKNARRLELVEQGNARRLGFAEDENAKLREVADADWRRSQELLTNKARELMLAKEEILTLKLSDEEKGRMLERHQLAAEEGSKLAHEEKSRQLKVEQEQRSRVWAIEEENARLKQVLRSSIPPDARLNPEVVGGIVPEEVTTARADFAAAGDDGQEDVPAHLGLRAFSNQVWLSKPSIDIAFSRPGTSRVLQGCVWRLWCIYCCREPSVRLMAVQLHVDCWVQQMRMRVPTCKFTVLRAFCRTRVLSE